MFDNEMRKGFVANAPNPPLILIVPNDPCSIKLSESKLVLFQNTGDAPTKEA